MLTESSFSCVLLSVFILSCTQTRTLDRSILCRSCRTSQCDRPGPQAKQSGYIRILSWEHLWGSRRPERNTCFHPIPGRYTTPVLSSETCCLGELTLVLEPGHESELCPVGYIVASMGTSIHPSDSACTADSREASTNACILCRRG